jgi:CheY-like chemotaxis protein
MERSDPAPGARRRVAVVDDAVEFLQLIRDVLDDRFDVSVFDGEEIIPEELVATDPDLLIIDLRLAPGQLTGLDLLTLIRAHASLRDVPIIVCSADVSQLRMHEAQLRALPRVALLAKPFALEDLEHAVESALAG